MVDVSQAFVIEVLHLNLGVDLRLEVLEAVDDQSVVVVVVVVDVGNDLLLGRLVTLLAIVNDDVNVGVDVRRRDVVVLDRRGSRNFIVRWLRRKTVKKMLVMTSQGDAEAITYTNKLKLFYSEP